MCTLTRGYFGPFWIVIALTFAIGCILSSLRCQCPHSVCTLTMEVPREHGRKLRSPQGERLASIGGVPGPLDLSELVGRRVIAPAASVEVSPWAHFRPELLVTLRSSAGGRESRDRCPALGHLLNDRQCRDHRVCHARVISRDCVDHVPMKALATVGHGEKGNQLGPAAL